MKCLGFALFLAVFTAVGASYVGNSHTEPLPVKEESFIKVGKCYSMGLHYIKIHAISKEIQGYHIEDQVTYTTHYDNSDKRKASLDYITYYYDDSAPCEKYFEAVKKYKKEREFKLLKAQVKNLELRIENIEYNITIEDTINE